MEGASSSFPSLETYKERLMTICWGFCKGHFYPECEAGLEEVSAPLRLCDPPAHIGSLPSNCKYLCIPKL